MEKQMGSWQVELTDIPQGLRNLALAENLSEEEVKTLAQITYRGPCPDTTETGSSCMNPSNAV